MKRIFLFLIFPLFSALLPLSPLQGNDEIVEMKWLTPEREGINISAQLDREEVRECFNAGLELEHRFLVKYCERVNRFGTSCGDAKRVVHNISYDPIQESYRVAEDRLDDSEDPIVSSHTTLDEALKNAGEVEELPLSYITSQELELVRSKVSRNETLLGLRVRSTCKGEMNRFFADLSYFLSFGIVDLYGYDSGWEYFELYGLPS